MAYYPNNPNGQATMANSAPVAIASNQSAIPVTDNSGSLTVDNAGTFATQVDGAALTALQKIDDPVLVDDAAFTPATSSVMMAGFEYDDTSPDSVDEGDAGAARMSANRNQYIQIRDGSGNERGAAVTAGNALTVDGSAVTQPVSNAGLTALNGAIAGTEVQVDIVGALPAGTNAIGKLAANSGVDIGDVDVTTVGTITPGTAATNLGKAEDAGHTTGDVGVMSLGVANTGDADISGTTLDYTPFSTDLTGAVRMIGNRDHDATDAGKPVKIGCKAESSPKGITLVADGDRTDAYADLDGLLMVKLNTSYADIISERVSDTGGSSTAFTNFSAVASTKNYVTAITVYNSSATAGYVDFRSGTGGSVLWTMPVPAGGGSVIASAQPLFATAANTALAYDVSGALSTVYISVSGFQSKA